jgi:predicted Zn-dependent protease
MMWTDREQTRAFLEEVLSTSDAAETQVVLGGGRVRIYRLSNNSVTEVSEESWGSLRLQLGYGDRERRRTGWSGTTNLQPEGIEALLARARELAQDSEPSEVSLGLPYPDEFESSIPDYASAYSQQVALAGPVLGADIVSEITLPCLGAGYSASGYIALCEGTLDPAGDPGVSAVANSNGLFQHYAPTRFHLFAEIASPDAGVGLVSEQSRDLASVDVASLLETAFERAALPGSGALTPGEYRVVLAPEAVAQLLAVLAPGFSYHRNDTGVATISEHMGETLFSESVTVRANPADPRLLDRPFDGEGWPCQALALIERGVPQSLAFTRQEAQAAGEFPSGYTPEPPFVGGAIPWGLVMAGHEGDLDALMSDVVSGLLVERFRTLGGRPGPRSTVDGSCLDSAFKVSYGRLSSSVPELRFRFDLFDLFASVVRIGEAKSLANAVVPPVVADRFRVI